MEHSAQRKSLKQKSFFSVAEEAAGLKIGRSSKFLPAFPFQKGKKMNPFYPDRAKKIPAKTIKAPQT
jgi:hypothetical protein